MVFSYPLIKTSALPPHLLQITCNNDKLSSMNGRSSGKQLFADAKEHLSRSDHVITSAAKFGGFSLNSVFKRCETCGGQGAIECPGCKGTGKNKKNGNIFERWKCFECQGFGLKSCPVCGKGGLTPEQRGER